jgi:hypothetical protein
MMKKCILFLAWFGWILFVDDEEVVRYRGSRLTFQIFWQVGLYFTKMLLHDESHFALGAVVEHHSLVV